MAASVPLATALALSIAVGASPGVGAGSPDPAARPAAAIDSSRLAAAAPGSSAGDQAPVAYTWPLPPTPEVVRSFGVGPMRWSVGHRRVDLAATGGVGSPVRAAADGTVTVAGPVAGRPVVVVLHRDGVRTTYEPVTPSVKVGDRVDRGDVLGALGVIGSHCSPACLHWGALRGPEYLDPLSLLADRGPILLLPLAGLPVEPPAEAPQR